MSFGVVQAEKMTTESGYSLGAGNASSFKNRIINGGMSISQYATSYAMTSQNASIQVVDRTKFAVYGSGAWPSGTFLTQTQETDAPAGFKNSYRVTVNQALTWTSTQLGAWFNQAIEGNNVADLAFGTASAKSVTISFWVKASKTGTLPVALGNASTDRMYTTTVTINSAGTWEYKSVTIPGDTTGTWLTSTSTGLSVFITPCMNSTWLPAASLNTWLGAQGEGAIGQTNFLTAVSDYIAITGFQLEVGTVATSFDQRPYNIEEYLCKRYYQKYVGGSTYGYVGFNTGVGTGTSFNATIGFEEEMRTAPSFTATLTGFGCWDGASLRAITATGTQYTTTKGSRMDMTVGGGGLTTGNSYSCYGSSSTVFQFSAEL